MEKHEIENYYILALLQAMLGAISNNFRAIWLIADEEKLDVFFLLSKESNEDREEIGDIIFEFEALQKRIINVTPHIVINNKEWLPPNEARMVFLKRRNT
jgi:hypothetical protein